MSCVADLFSPYSGCIDQLSSVRVACVVSMRGKYTIEICHPGGEYAGIDKEFGHTNDPNVTLKVCSLLTGKYPDRIVMLCERGRVLACSDRPDTIAAPMRR